METGSEQRDWIEHLEALKRFGGQLPLSERTFAPNYIPRRCRRQSAVAGEGRVNLMAESAKWDEYLREAFQKKMDSGADEPQAEPEECDRDDQSCGPDASSDTTQRQKRGTR